MSFFARPAGRTVHVKIQPRPRSIADTRAVLQALRRFGEVEMFKHLKYEPENPAPNSFLATYTSRESAINAMNKEVVKLNYEPLPEGNQAGDGRGAETGSELSQRPAKMAIRESYLDHERYISKQPYFSTYGKAPFNSLFADLHTRLPARLHAYTRLEYDAPEVRGVHRRLKDVHSKTRMQALSEKGYMGMWEQAQADKVIQSTLKTPSKAFDQEENVGELAGENQTINNDPRSSVEALPTSTIEDAHSQCESR